MRLRRCPLCPKQKHWLETSASTVNLPFIFVLCASSGSNLATAFNLNVLHCIVFVCKHVPHMRQLYVHLRSLGFSCFPSLQLRLASLSLLNHFPRSRSCPVKLIVKSCFQTQLFLCLSADSFRLCLFEFFSQKPIWSAEMLVCFPRATA